MYCGPFVKREKMAVNRKTPDRSDGGQRFAGGGNRVIYATCTAAPKRSGDDEKRVFFFAVISFEQ